MNLMSGLFSLSDASDYIIVLWSNPDRCIPCRALDKFNPASHSTAIKFITLDPWNGGWSQQGYVASQQSAPLLELYKNSTLIDSIQNSSAAIGKIDAWNRQYGQASSIPAQQNDWAPTSTSPQTQSAPSSSWWDIFKHVQSPTYSAPINDTASSQPSIVDRIWNTLTTSTAASSPAPIIKTAPSVVNYTSTTAPDKTTVKVDNQGQATSIVQWLAPGLTASATAVAATALLKRGTASIPKNAPVQVGGTTSRWPLILIGGGIIVSVLALVVMSMSDD